MNNKNEDRYIRLGGYPLDKPLWKTFHQSAAAIAPAIIAPFVIASDLMMTGGQNLKWLAPFSLLYPVFSIIKCKLFENLFIEQQFPQTSLTYKILMPSQSKMLAIDTQPDHPTSPENLLNAKKLRNTMIAANGLTGATVCGGFAYAANHFSSSDISISAADAITGLGIVAEMASPYFATFTAAALRFNKVVKGEFAIVDSPPPRRIEKAADAAERQTVFQPI